MYERRPLKILSLAVLALVGVMAVNISAAQAEWVLRKNATPVSQLKLNGELLLSELLFGLGLGLKIHCTGGTALAVLKLEEGSSKVAANLDGTFTGCELQEFGSLCDASSDPTGKNLGQISFKATGGLLMQGESTYALVSAEPFTTVYFFGELCRFDEWGSELSFTGSANLFISNPAMDLKVHLFKFEEEELFMGEEEFVMHGQTVEGSPEPWILSHIQEESGASWSIQLKGL